MRIHEEHLGIVISFSKVMKASGSKLGLENSCVVTSPGPPCTPFLQTLARLSERDPEQRSKC